MSGPALDILSSPTLKHLRERWWNDDFTAFLRNTLRPRPGNRILDVGCGAGTAEVHLGRSQLPQTRLFGVDLRADKVVAARKEVAGHNLRVGFAVADACHLPFRDASFDATFCVAVLQHVARVDVAVGELARVTVPGGRLVAVEPDNVTRCSYSSVPSGTLAFELSARLHAAAAAGLGEGPDPAIGLRLPAVFTAAGVEPLEVRPFPVSHTWLGAPAAEIWASRRAAVERTMQEVARPEVQAVGRELVARLNDCELEAGRAGSGFVEIQNIMLFATVGQKNA